MIGTDIVGIGYGMVGADMGDGAGTSMRGLRIPRLCAGCGKRESHVFDVAGHIDNHDELSFGQAGSSMYVLYTIIGHEPSWPERTL